MTQPLQVIETLARVTPLGVAFWDDMTQANVSDGLVVSGWARNRPNRRFSLDSNRTGVFTLHNIWPEVEHGRGDAPYWDSLLPTRTWIITVEDTSGRFIPFSFEAEVPARGRFQWQCGSPLEGGAVPLFSAPNRALPGSLGVIRADLRDATHVEPPTSQFGPAAWAVVEAWHAGQLLARGLANAHGSVLIPLRYPAPPDGFTSSPPGSPLGSPPGLRTPLSQASWLVELRAFYSPTAVHSGPVPDLCVALSQGPATLLGLAAPPETLVEIEVVFGVEKIVRTQALGAAGARDLPELLLLP